jgi:outer membrane protein TolC
MKRRSHVWSFVELVVLGGTFTLAANSYAQPAQTPLSEPLTLSTALRVSLESHPDIDLAQTQLRAAQIRLNQLESTYGFDAFVELQPRVASRASNPGVDFQNDSRYGVVLDKRISDFGRTKNRISAAQSEIEARAAGLIAQQDQHLIQVMRRFFSVILADQAYQMYNERLAIDFFRYSRAQERRDRFEQFSDLEIAEKEALYRKSYAARHRADLERRQRRHELALALGRPGEWSGQLQRPDLSEYLERAVPDYAELVDDILAKSPVVLARRRELDAAEAKIEVARKINSPVLSFEFEAREYYDASFASRDRYRANLKFIAPIFNGTDRRDTEIALAENAVFQKRAELLAAEFAVREEVLGLLTDLQVGRAEIAAAKAQQTYQSYYQDRARAMYEMEMSADLGDAQAAAVEAMLDMSRAEFQQTLRWARLDALRAERVVLLREN